MDFFDHQDQAKANSRGLIIYFLFATAIIVFVVYLVVMTAILAYTDIKRYQSHRHRFNRNGLTTNEPIERQLQRYWDPDVLIGCAIATTVVIALGSWMKSRLLKRLPGHYIAMQLRGRRLDPQSAGDSDRKILNVVEEMAIAAGMPVPTVYELAGERGINAFAAGLSTDDAVIGVTTGALNVLNRDELQAIMAHEFSHILNGDMRLNVEMTGLLHGMLSISAIGYYLMSDDDDDEVSGGRAMPYGGVATAPYRERGPNILAYGLGAALFGTGYLGVVLVGLIKSAICREREYLADASAVQFTRNPQAVTSALKKIGGFQHGSKLNAGRVEEYCHMFVANALRFGGKGLLSLHPPLVDRIRRIEPDFNGVFPQLMDVPLHGPVVELETAKYMPGYQAEKPTPVKPHSIRSILPAVAAATAAAPFRLDVATVISSLGTASPEHLAYARKLNESIPEPFRNEVGSSAGAQAVIFSLLLSESEITRAYQANQLRNSVASGVTEAVERLIGEIKNLRREMRLPLIELAIPALQTMSKDEYKAFQNAVYALVSADNNISLFELVVHRMLVAHIEPKFDPRRSRGKKTRPLAKTLSSCAVVLSALARVGRGSDSGAATRAFDAGKDYLGPSGSRLVLLETGSCGPTALDPALDELGNLAGADKRMVLSACIASIAQDGEVTIDEAEVLRAVADALGCPMPPLLPGAPPAESEAQSPTPTVGV